MNKRYRDDSEPSNDFGSGNGRRRRNVSMQQDDAFVPQSYNHNGAPPDWVDVAVVTSSERQGRRFTPAIRLSMTKSGQLRVSYTLGTVQGDEFRPRMHIDDRDILDYMDLLRRVSIHVKESFETSGSNPHEFKSTLGEIGRFR